MRTGVVRFAQIKEVREFRAKREYSHALRLENASLRESLSDLRAANANPIVRFAHEMGSRRVSKKEDGVA